MDKKKTSKITRLKIKTIRFQSVVDELGIDFDHAEPGQTGFRHHTAELWVEVDKILVTHRHPSAGCSSRFFSMAEIKNYELEDQPHCAE